MKKKGSKLEFAAERRAELMRGYRTVLSWPGVRTHKEIAQEVVKLPASRFYVSEERAAIVMSEIDRGVAVLATMRGAKRRMYEDLYERFVAERAANPGATLADNVRNVVYGEAPELYMEAGHALFLLRKGS